ncbi:MAG: aldo/keto reductase [Bacteroidia bacterium]|nr:aldo/keto reductase [Bacteroidia bacterium]
MSGLHRLGLGTAQFGLPYGISNVHGQLAAPTVFSILDRARSEGVGLLDTAAAYGASESVLGQYPQLDQFRIVTKLRPLNTSAPDLQKELQASLGRLQQPSVYGYLFHRTEDVLEQPHRWQTLQTLKANGLIAKLGLSVYAPEQIEAAWSLNIEPDLLQIPYSLFDQRFEALLPVVAEKGVEIHARSVFLQGAPFLSATQRQDLFGYDPPGFGIAAGWAHRLGVSLPHLLLASAALNPYIHHFVIGVDSLASFTLNLAYEGVLSKVAPVVEELKLSARIADTAVVLPIHWKPKR